MRSLCGRRLTSYGNCDILLSNRFPERGVILIEIKRALRPFKMRLALEGALRGAAAGALTVLPVWLALILLRRIAGIGGAWAQRMPLVWLAASALWYALRYRPTDRKTAARIDAAGQMERAATMVEFAGSDGVLPRLQREDAASQLKKLPASVIRISVSRPALIACACLAALTAAAALAPQAAYDALPFARPARQQEDPEAAILREKLEQLRGQIDASELKEADKEQLLARLDALFDQLNAGRLDLAALGSIREMMDDMSGTIAELTPRDTYAAVLLEYESLQPLGEAIFGGNMDIVTLVIDSMSHQLLTKDDIEQVDALMDLVYDVNASLSKPLRDTSQENLRQAMMMLAGGLESAAGLVYSRRDNTSMIETAFDSLKIYISEFLGVPLQEERYDPYADKWWEDPDAPKQYSAAMRIPLKKEIVLSPAETEHVYDPPKALGMSSYAPGEPDGKGGTQRIPAPADGAKDGTVPYGTVYGAYYAQYLEAVQSGALPESLADEAEAYFGGI